MKLPGAAVALISSVPALCRRQLPDTWVLSRLLSPGIGCLVFVRSSVFDSLYYTFTRQPLRRLPRRATLFLQLAATSQQGTAIALCFNSVTADEANPPSAQRSPPGDGQKRLICNNAAMKSLPRRRNSLSSSASESFAPARRPQGARAWAAPARCVVPSRLQTRY